MSTAGDRALAESSASTQTFAYSGDRRRLVVGTVLTRFAGLRPPKPPDRPFREVTSLVEGTE